MTYNVDSDFIERYKSFLSSDEFSVSNTEVVKSDYWKFHAEAVNIDIIGNAIILDGKSGFYHSQISLKKDPLGYIKSRIARAVKDPTALKKYLARKFGLKKQNNMDFKKALDLVMNHDPLSDPDLSTYRINFLRMQDKDGIFKSYAEMERDYQREFKKDPNFHVVKSYYYYNILQYLTDLKNKQRIVEIGGGNGNLFSLLHKKIQGAQIIDIDLPETLAHAIPFIANTFPDAKILMPHEVKSMDFEIGDYDFIFMVPEQIKLLKKNSVDLVVNTHSFQEMTQQQIAKYFAMSYDILKKGGHFFVVNRVEKIPCNNCFKVESDIPPNRFCEYPWDNNNKILAYEICKYDRLARAFDNVYLRLDEIR